MRQETAHSGARGARLSLWAPIEVSIALYGLLGSAFVVARFTVGERWRVVAFANNFIPWWALAALAATLLALPARRRWWLIPLQAPLLIAFVILYGDRFLPSRALEADDGAPELTVMTYNLQTRGTSASDLEVTIRALRPDVVGLQEFHRTHMDALAALEDLYPHQMVHLSRQGVGMALLSRFPLSGQEAVNPSARYTRSIRARLDVDGTTIGVYLVHPDTPQNTYWPWSYDHSRRDRQLAEARTALAADDGPVLMLCDCNMSDQSDAYRAFDRLLDDSFRQAGQGLGFTFPAQLLPSSPSPVPLLRLDYIWHSEHFSTRQARVVRDHGTSDHYPVIARLVLNQRSTPDE